MRELLGWLDFGFLQLPPHLNRVDGSRIVLEVVVIFPPAAFDDLEGHLFGKAVPIIHIGASVDASDGQVRADLYSFQGVDSCVIFDGALAEEAVVLEVMLDVDDGDGPKVPSCVLKGYLQGLLYGYSYVSTTNRVFLLHVGEGEPDSGFSVPDGDFEVDAEVFFGRGEELDIELSGR